MSELEMDAVGTDAAAPGRSLPLWMGARRLALVLLRPATLGLACLFVGALIPLDWLTAGPSFCPFKVATGLPCPGCGLTRSSVALLHGDLWTSAYFHPLGVPLVLSVGLIAAVDALVWLRSRRPGSAPVGASWLLDRLARTPAPWIAIGALTVVWLIRLPLYVAGAWVF